MDYNYLMNVKEDAKNAILENYDKEELKEMLLTNSGRNYLEDKLNEQLWIDDSVTGNASGSYTFSIYEAEEYII